MPDVSEIVNAVKMFRQYREQGTVEECAAALAHCQACNYAQECLSD
jgi:hypothetical protein